MSSKAQRSVVLDVRAPCEKVAEHVLAKSPVDFIGGAARLLSHAEKRGALVLNFASVKRKEHRVEVVVEREGDRIVYRLKGDMKGAVSLVGLPRGGGCRLYIEAEAEGPLVDEYGGEALARIINRIVTHIISRFPAVLQPRLPRGKLGDAFIELLELLNLAAGGTSRVMTGGRMRSIAFNLAEGQVITVDGMSEEEAGKAAEKLAPALKSFVEAIEELGLGSPERLVVAAGRYVLVASHTAGLSVVTLLEKTENTS